MSSNEAIDTAVAAWVATTTGLSSAAVFWAEHPRKQVPQSYAVLSWVSESDRGLGDLQQDVNGDGDLEQGVSMPQSLTLQVTLASYVVTAAKNGRRYGSRMRAASRFDSARAVLATANLGLIEIGPGRDDTVTVDNHRLYQWVIEVTLSSTRYEEDTETPISTIETVVLTTEIKDETGATLPIPPNVEDKEIP